MPPRRVAQLPVAAATLERRYGLAGEPLLFQTNDPILLAAAGASFGRFPVPPGGPEPLRIQLFSETAPGQPRSAADGDGRIRSLAPASGQPGSSVVFRVHGQTLLISDTAGDVATVDVASGRALGFVSAATAEDGPWVRYSFIEAMGLAMLACARGYLAVHASGVEREGAGLILHGPSGSGKSTLTIACARRGYGVFAEDVVFARATAGGLETWGMPWTQRLLPDAVALFPELAGIAPRRQANGEVKLEVDLDGLYPGRARPRAVPQAVVLLERAAGGPTRLELVDPPTADLLEIHWPWDGGWTAGHDRLAGLLGALPTYRLRVAGSPDDAVDALDALVESSAELERAADAR